MVLSVKTDFFVSDVACLAFYEKCGFEKKENEMAKYANDRCRTPAPPPAVEHKL